MGENSSFIFSLTENHSKEVEVATPDLVSTYWNISQYIVTPSSYQHTKTSLNFYDPVAIVVTPAKQATGSMVGISELVDTKAKMPHCIFDVTRGAMGEKNLAAKELSALGLDTYCLAPDAVMSRVGSETGWIITNYSPSVTYKGSIDHMNIDTTRTRLLHANLHPLKDIETINACQVMGLPHLSEIHKGLLLRMGDNIEDIFRQNKAKAGATLLPVGMFINLPPLQPPGQMNVHHQFPGDASDDEVISIHSSEFSDLDDGIDEEERVQAETDRRNHERRRISIYLRIDEQRDLVAEFSLDQCPGYWALSRIIKQSRPGNLAAGGDDTSVAHVLWPWGLNFLVEYVGNNEATALDPLSVKWHVFSNTLSSVVMSASTGGERILVKLYDTRGEDVDTLAIPKRNLANYVMLHKIMNIYASGFREVEPDDKIALDPWPMGNCEFYFNGDGAVHEDALNEWKKEVYDLVETGEDIESTGDEDDEVVNEDDGAALPLQDNGNGNWSRFLDELSIIEVHLHSSNLGL